MLHDLIQQISAMPFFQTLTFGIIAMIIVGSSWCLIGFVMGDAPKRGIEPSLVQFFSYIFALVVGLVVMFVTKGYPACSAKVFWLTWGALALASFMNFFMLQLMSYAMQRGPNGVIWAIIQSALIFPALGSHFIFGKALTSFQIMGIGLLLVALIFFAMTKNNTNSGKGWKLPAFICLAICAVQQNLTTAPSYYPEANLVGSIVKSLSSVSGGLLAAFIYTAVRWDKHYSEQLKQSIKNPTLWKYIVAMQAFSLIFAYTLFYPGFDAMGHHGASGMCYPLMVGSCIVSFTLTSVFVLKEKIQKIQIYALVFCLIGLVGLCFPQTVMESIYERYKTKLDNPLVQRLIFNKKMNLQKKEKRPVQQNRIPEKTSENNSGR